MNDLWVLSYDAGINGQSDTLTSMPIALCTSADEAKAIADRIHGTSLSWSNLAEEDDEPDACWTADVRDILPEGNLLTEIHVNAWWIQRSGGLNQILRNEWDIDWDGVRDQWRTTAL